MRIVPQELWNIELWRVKTLHFFLNNTSALYYSKVGGVGFGNVKSMLSKTPPTYTFHTTLKFL